MEAKTIRSARILEATTLKRAAGEVLLIVVGVLIALAASDWQEGRRDRRTELDLLGELGTAMEADLAVLKGQVDRYRGVESRVDSLLAYIRSGRPYTDSLDAYFGALYGFYRPELNTAGYESLKSQGLGLVSDDALRSQIAAVYEGAYPSAADAMDSERIVILELLRPYFLIHFRDLNFNTSATPLDYATIARDTEFLNLADYRRQLLKQNSLPLLEGAIADIQDLLSALQRELGG